ncbi:MAG: 4Fe-4S dicluster domain-containing protein [Deltaproteobacteria bacterium]|nr:4Fe-4S dicluster domain-containing protein [Deltaproteobacteria bacterium]
MKDIKQCSNGQEKTGAGVSRRTFLKCSGIVVIGVGAGGLAAKKGYAEAAVSQGYLLVDSAKCQGCTTCMLACSLVHEGYESLSQARIQVVQDPFAGFPDDIQLAQCRQCVSPACLGACPVGALHVDSANGNIRTVDEQKCIGCKACISACPYTPGRTIWNFAESHSQKCDLCAGASHWNEEGGPGGKQACVEMCPMKAITFTTQVPVQIGEEGYNVNLRDAGWSVLGYPRD